MSENNTYQSRKHPSSRPDFINPGRISRGYESERGEFVTTDGYVHQLDENGFRLDPIPSVEGGLSLLLIGCSFTFGYGLPYEATLACQLTRLLSQVLQQPVISINLAIPGTSNDYISRQLHEAAEGLRPDIVFVGFTQAARIEHWFSPSRYTTVRPGAPPRPEWSEARCNLQKHYEAIASPANDLARLYKSVNLCSLVCRTQNLPFYYTYATYRQTPPLQQWLSEDEYVGFTYPRIDLAGDHAHPGAQSNHLLALGAVAKMVSTNFLNRGERIQRNFQLGEAVTEEAVSGTTWTLRGKQSVEAGEWP